jgi:rare lipoprotein A
LPPATGGSASSSGSQPASAQVTTAPAGQVAEETLPPLPGAQAAPKTMAPSSTPAPAPSSATVPIEDQVMAQLEPDGKVTKIPVKATNMYVQAGAFTNQANASRLVTKLSKLAPVRIMPVFVGDQRFYRVRLGPIASLDEADRILGQVIASGNDQARIVVE